MLEWGRAANKASLYLAWHLGFWLNGILAVMIILEQEYGQQGPFLPRWLFATFAIFGLLHGFIHSFVRRFYSRDLACEFLKVLLDTMLLGIPRADEAAIGIRLHHEGGWA